MPLMSPHYCPHTIICFDVPILPWVGFHAIYHSHSTALTLPSSAYCCDLLLFFDQRCFMMQQFSGQLDVHNLGFCGDAGCNEQYKRQ